VNIITKVVVAFVAFGIVLELYFCSASRDLKWAVGGGWSLLVLKGSGKHRNDFSK